MKSWERFYVTLGIDCYERDRTLEIIQIFNFQKYYKTIIFFKEVIEWFLFFDIERSTFVDSRCSISLETFSLGVFLDAGLWCAGFRKNAECAVFELFECGLEKPFQSLYQFQYR